MVELVGIVALFAALVYLVVRLGRKFAAHLSDRRAARVKSHLDWVNPAPRRRSKLI